MTHVGQEGAFGTAGLLGHLPGVRRFKFGALAVSDVGHRSHQPQWLPALVLLCHHGVGFHPDPAVEAPHPVLEHLALQAAVEQRANLWPKSDQVIRMDTLMKLVQIPLRVHRHITDQLAPTGRKEHRRRRQLPVPQRQAGRFHRQLQAVPRFVEGLLRQQPAVRFPVDRAAQSVQLMVLALNFRQQLLGPLTLLLQFIETALQVLGQSIGGGWHGV